MKLVHKNQNRGSASSLLEKEVVMSSNVAEAKSRRLQFEFSPDAYARLERMKEETDASSFAELVRNALRVYDWVKQKERDGYELALMKDNETVQSVKLIL